VSSTGKVLGFLLARLLPRNINPEFLCTWLLDAEPVVIERTILVLDERCPDVLVSMRNTIGFGQHT